MVNRSVQFFARWFAICTALGCLAACGKVTQSKNQGLKITLAPPADSDPLEFWMRVQSKSLRVDGDGSVVDWNEGQSQELAVRDGDKVTFLGKDASGTLVVTGEAVAAAGENSLTIPLHRMP